jgi:hypothetical protein
MGLMNEGTAKAGNLPATSRQRKRHPNPLNATFAARSAP